MEKKKIKVPSTGTSIAEKIIANINKISKNKVIDLSEIKRARIRSEELRATIASDNELSRLDPLHALYVYGQNQMSVLIEQLIGLPAMSKLYYVYDKAFDKYLPEGPPMSPITASYFNCWSFFDLCIGVKKESLGTIIIQVCNELKVDEGLIKIFEKMQASRMGFYIHEGFSGKYVLLRELVTERSIRATVPSGHKGERGEIWLARIMPDASDAFPLGYSVVFTTPYIIGKVQGDSFCREGDEAGWLSYFDRTCEKAGKLEKIQAYENLMKYGRNRHYWNEYIFESFVSFVHEAIFLSGFPDIALSRPHSVANSQY